MSDLAHSFCGREVQDLVVFAKSLVLPDNAVMPSSLRSVSKRSKNHVSEGRRADPRDSRPIPEIQGEPIHKSSIQMSQTQFPPGLMSQ